MGPRAGCAEYGGWCADMGEGGVVHLVWRVTLHAPCPSSVAACNEHGQVIVTIWSFLEPAYHFNCLNAR